MEKENVPLKGEEQKEKKKLDREADSAEAIRSFFPRALQPWRAPGLRRRAGGTNPISR